MVTKTKYLGEWLQKQNGRAGGLTSAATAYICFVTIIYIGNLHKQTAGRWVVTKTAESERKKRLGYKTIWLQKRTLVAIFSLSGSLSVHFQVFFHIFVAYSIASKQKICTVVTKTQRGRQRGYKNVTMFL